MTAADALVSRVAEVLGDHLLELDFFVEDVACSGCDWKPNQDSPDDMETQHRAHLATVLTELVTSERAAAVVEALESAAVEVDDLPWDAVRCDSIAHRLRANAHIYRSTNTTPTKETP